MEDNRPTPNYFDPSLATNQMIDSLSVQAHSSRGPSPTPIGGATSIALARPPSPLPPASSNLYLSQPYLPPIPQPFATTPSPSVLADPSTAASTSAQPMPIIQFDPRASTSDEDDDEDDGEGGGAGGKPPMKKRKSTANLRATANKSADEEEKNRRKIHIEYIEEKSKRHITFSKRKAGIMKKAYELSTLTGTQVLLLVVSESGWVYTFTTEKFKPLVKEDEHGQLSQGQKLIAACLESKETNPNPSASFQPQQTTAPNSQNFEANSSIHGGQIALKTNTRNLNTGGLGNPPARPIASNRRVSGRGRHNIPIPIQTHIPPVPHLPTPGSGGYLDPALHSPNSPRGRGPLTPNRMGDQMQQMQMHGQQQNAYQDLMLQRQEVMQMDQHQAQGGYGGGYGDSNMGYQSSMGQPPPHNSYMLQNSQPPPQQFHHQRMYPMDYPPSQHDPRDQQSYHPQDDANRAYMAAMSRDQ